jgi:hypothetical protein
MKTQHFVDFYQKDSSGKILPATGTDAHYNIDGRFGLLRAARFAKDEMDFLNIHLNKNFVGFKLFRTTGRRTGEEIPYFISDALRG